MGKKVQIQAAELQALRAKLYPRKKGAPRPSPTPLDQLIGRRIRMRRTDLGLTQTQLGDFIELTFQQIQKYERGANRVSAARLFHFARILQADPGWFMDWPGAKKPEGYK